jgi:hypothetical protein
VRAIVATALWIAACSGKKEEPPPINPPSLPGNTSTSEIGTKVGNGRVLNLLGVDVSSVTNWTRVVPLDKQRVALAGDVNGEAFALISNDRGVSWSAHHTKSDGITTWSVGADGTLVMGIAKRMIPKKTPPTGTVLPIDTLTYVFAAPGEKLSAPSPLLAPDPEGKKELPMVPRGEGMAAVLGPSLASIVVELKPKSFAIAYAAGPSDPIPAPTELPKDEVPVNAAYGRAPVLLTANQKQLLARPWPKPGEPLATPKPVDKVGVTKTLLEELSKGPECEWGGWSFKRVVQPKDRVFVLGVSPERTVFIEVPPTTVATSPMSCSADRIAVEAVNPEDKLPTIVTCKLEGECTIPGNRPFLKPWPEQHDRELFTSLTTEGVIALQAVKTKSKWAVFVSESTDGGKLFNLQRPVGEGVGNPEDGYEVGSMFSLGDRTLLLLSAKISKTTRRSWYAIATDNGGSTWSYP